MSSSVPPLKYHLGIAAQSPHSSRAPHGSYIPVGSPSVVVVTVPVGCQLGLRTTRAATSDGVTGRTESAPSRRTRHSTSIASVTERSSPIRRLKLDQRVGCRFVKTCVFLGRAPCPIAHARWRTRPQAG